MKKITCKVCKTRFTANKEARYLASENTAFLTALTTPAKSFECFDCPACGCQNAVHIRMAAIKKRDKGSDTDEQ